MPTSDPSNISSVVMAAHLLRPKSVLDVGIGHGKYGFLLREYLDIWHHRLSRNEWQSMIVGVEGFAEYRNPTWDYSYSEVHIEKIEDFLAQPAQFDLAVICDVIEHFERAEARKVVRRLLEVADIVLLTTPTSFFAQAAEEGNDLERHRCLWTADCFDPGVHVASVPLLSCSLFIASSRAIPRDVRLLCDPRHWAYLRARHRFRRLGPVGLAMGLVVKLVLRVLT